MTDNGRSSDGARDKLRYVTPASSAASLKALRHLAGEARGHAKELVIVQLTGLGVAALSTAIPFAFKRLADELQAGKDSSADTASTILDQAPQSNRVGACRAPLAACGSNRTHGISCFPRRP